MNPQFFHLVGEAMCAGLNEILWPQRQLWLTANTGKTILCKVGSGQATYFKPQTKVDTIVFGKKMVASKCQNFAGPWLSYRELVRFNYFGGNTSPLNLLAHTVCHEFAHYVQSHCRQRRRGSVHNADFYRYLSDIHRLGLAQQLRQYLLEKVPSLAELQPLEQKVETSTVTKVPALRAGDTVSFNYKRKQITATVIRVNRKTVSATAAGKFGTRPRNWRIPFSLLLK